MSTYLRSCLAVAVVTVAVGSPPARADFAVLAASPQSASTSDATDAPSSSASANSGDASTAPVPPAAGERAQERAHALVRANTDKADDQLQKEDVQHHSASPAVALAKPEEASVGTVTATQSVGEPASPSAAQNGRQPAPADVANASEPRLQVAVRIVGGYPDSVGAAVALKTTEHHLFFEAGAAASPQHGWTYDFLFGHEYQLHDGRVDHEGWTFSMPVAIGFRSVTSDCCSGNTTARVGGELLVGIEAVRWLSEHFGFDAQVRAGAFLYNSSVTNPNDVSGALASYNTFGAAPEGHLGIGVIF